MNDALPGVVVVGPHGSHLQALQRHLADEVCHDTNNTTETQHESILAPVLDRYCQKLTDQVTEQINIWLVLQLCITCITCIIYYSCAYYYCVYNIVYIIIQ